MLSILQIANILDYLEKMKEDWLEIEWSDVYWNIQLFIHERSNLKDFAKECVVLGHESKYFRLLKECNNIEACKLFFEQLHEKNLLNHVEFTYINLVSMEYDEGINFSAYQLKVNINHYAREVFSISPKTSMDTFIEDLTQRSEELGGIEWIHKHKDVWNEEDLRELYEDNGITVPDIKTLHTIE